MLWKKHCFFINSMIQSLCNRCTTNCVLWGENMFVVSLCICLVLFLIFVLRAILIRALKEKGVFLLFKFRKIPKEDRELYDLERMRISVSDDNITAAFFMTITLSFVFTDLYVLAFVFVVMLISFIIYIYKDSPEEIYKDYLIKKSWWKIR